MDSAMLCKASRMDGMACSLCASGPGSSKMNVRAFRSSKISPLPSSMPASCQFPGTASTQDTDTTAEWINNTRRLGNRADQVVVVRNVSSPAAMADDVVAAVGATPVSVVVPGVLALAGTTAGTSKCGSRAFRQAGRKSKCSIMKAWIGSIHSQPS